MRYQASGGAIDTLSPNPTSTSFGIGGLTASTQYVVEIRAICTSGDTSEANSAIGVTECSDISSFPYVQDFTTTNVSLNCWSTLSNSGTDEWAYGVPTYFGSALVNSSMAYLYYGSTHDDYLISPRWTVDAGTSDRISFDAYNTFTAPYIFI